jgi:hypothetical protein
VIDTARRNKGVSKKFIFPRYNCHNAIQARHRSDQLWEVPLIRIFKAYLVRWADRIITGMYYITPGNAENFLGCPAATLSLTGTGNVHPIEYDILYRIGAAAAQAGTSCGVIPKKT